MVNKRYFIIYTIFEGLLIFAPLIVSTIAIIKYRTNTEGWFNTIVSRFSYIDGNYYLVNNVLLAYIIAAYLTILIGFIFYFNGLHNDIFHYSGDNKFVVLLNKLSFYLLLFCVYTPLVVYILFLFVSCSGYIFIGNKIFNLHNLVLANKYLSILVFGIFLMTDSFTWLSNLIQKEENQKLLGSKETDTEIIRRIDHNNNDIDLAKVATYLINIPVFVLTMASVFFTQYLEGAERFKGIVNQQLHYIEIPRSLENLCHIGVQLGGACSYPKPLNGVLFDLFMNGLETGIITASIIISQFIFIVLRAKWKWRNLKLNLAAQSVHGNTQQASLPVAPNLPSV
jgi:hypothetical protein